MGDDYDGDGDQVVGLEKEEREKQTAQGKDIIGYQFFGLHSRHHR
jgi:hypothetical protein